MSRSKGIKELNPLFIIVFPTFNLPSMIGFYKGGGFVRSYHIHFPSPGHSPWGYSWMVLLIALLPLMGQAQEEEDIEVHDSSEPVAWLGMDFTRAQFLNPGISTKDLKTKYIPRWNGLLGLEWDKFDIESFFGYEDVSLCFDRSLERNWDISADSLLHYSRKGMDRLSKTELDQVVSGYQGASERSLGLLFIVESFGKFGEEDFGYIWVTFLDLRNGELLMSKRIKGNAGGRGKVNYWIGVAFQVLEKAPAKMGFE